MSRGLIASALTLALAGSTVAIGPALAVGEKVKADVYDSVDEVPLFDSAGDQIGTVQPGAIPHRVTYLAEDRRGGVKIRLPGHGEVWIKEMYVKVDTDDPKIDCTRVVKREETGGGTRTLSPECEE